MKCTLYKLYNCLKLILRLDCLPLCSIWNRFALFCHVNIVYVLDRHTKRWDNLPYWTMWYQLDRAMAVWKSATILLFLLGNFFLTDAFKHLSGQHLRSHLHKERYHIRPNIILILTDDQDIELGELFLSNRS